MKNYDICKKIKKTSVRIIVPFNGNFSEGSGVIISKDGLIATASHVIHDEEGKIGKEILVRKEWGEYIAYKPIVEHIKISIEGLKKPIFIDLALLAPIGKGLEGEYCEIEENPILGDEVFTAGFPQEMSLPFEFDQILDKNKISLSDKEQFGLYDKGKQLLIKKAMIGRVESVNVNEMKSSILYLDNACSPGASGGPVLNREGKLVGINIAMGLMTFKDEYTVFSAPTGTGIALNPQILLELKKQYL